MECELMRESLESYAAGRLAGEEAVRLEAHLKGCPACGRELRWVRILKAGVRGAPLPALPADLRAELMRQAAAFGASRQAAAPSWRSRFESWRLAWRLAAGLGFASAGAAAAAFLVLGRFGAGTEELSLDEVLVAHSRYELTMPAADREAIFADLGLRLSQGGDSHD